MPDRADAMEYAWKWKVYTLGPPRIEYKPMLFVHDEIYTKEKPVEKVNYFVIEYRTNINHIVRGTFNDEKFALSYAETLARKEPGIEFYTVKSVLKSSALTVTTTRF